MLEAIKKWFTDTVHRCTPMKYPETGETGETIIFHWEVNWMFSQEFHVCSECHKVKVLSEVSDGCVLGGYRKEIDGKKWSGSCSYAKVPSIGRDKLTINHTELQAEHKTVNI